MINLLKHTAPILRKDHVSRVQNLNPSALNLSRTLVKRLSPSRRKSEATKECIRPQTQESQSLAGGRRIQPDCIFDHQGCGIFPRHGNAPVAAPFSIRRAQAKV